MSLHGRIRTRARARLRRQSATLNAGRTKIHCYQLLKPCHASGVSKSVCSFHILLLHPATFFVLLWQLSVYHFLNYLYCFNPFLSLVLSLSLSLSLFFSLFLFVTPILSTFPNSSERGREVKRLSPISCFAYSGEET